VWRTTALEGVSLDEWWSDHHDQANTGRWEAGAGALALLGFGDLGGASLGPLVLLAAGWAIGSRPRLVGWRRRRG
jgi:hypothetical protein